MVEQGRDRLRSHEKPKRVVMLGHSGFIGSRLRDYMLSRSPGVELVCHSYPELDLIREADTERLVPFLDHTAALVVLSWIKRQFADTLDAFTNNLKMVTNLCKLLEKHPVARLVFFSSAAVYGEDVHNTNITEDTAPQPRSYYGAAKFAAEFLFRRAMDHHPDSSLVILRPATAYGPGDKGAFYGPTGFLRAAVNKEPIVLWGDGTEQREFIFIDDLVKIVHDLIFHTYDGVVNLAAGNSYTFVDALEIVSGLLKRELHVTTRERTKRKVDNVFSNRRLRTIFPEFTPTGLAEGLRLTLKEDYRP